jgi:signal peptidase I
MRKFFASALEVIEVALVAIGTVFLIRSFLFQPFLVSGASMVPNFSNGDYLLVDELTYHIRTPERGEVIVFRYPNDPSTYFIKRIIGLPGEKVRVQDGHVTVINKEHPNGIEIPEAYLPSTTITNGATEFTLTNDQYFVLGDNRPFSFDSRSWGPLEKDHIVGLARLRLWPLADFRAFAAPAYNL